jgi:CheY-like chemotaxis protein
MADKEIIVAIDDSVITLSVYQKILSGLYDLRLCKSAVEGLNLLNSVNAAIILLDIEMPDISGFEFLHQIRKIPKLIRTPVIVISSHSGNEFVSHALSRGANALLPKPVEAAVLLDKVDELLKNPPKGGIFDL